jgi:AraC family transcriptional regulator
MSRLPTIIPSYIVNFKSLNDDPIFARRRQLQYGTITLTHIRLLPNSGIYIGAQQVVVARHCGLPLRMEWRSPGGDSVRSKMMIPGTIQVKAAQEQFWQRWFFPADVLAVAFDKAFFENLTREATGSAVDLVGELGISDPALSQLTALLDRELCAGGLNGRFYAENIGAALAAYLAQRRTGKRLSTVFREPRLAPARLKRVIDYIDTNLDGALGLTGISAIAGLNAHHFAHAFKASMGMPPHRFIIERRVDKARRLLDNRQQSIAEIAIACGFANQSHFTEHFRRVVGTTPAKYRRSL